MKEKFHKHANEGKKGCFLNRKKKLGLTYRTIVISYQSIGKRDGLELERMYAMVAIINNSLVDIGRLMGRTVPSIKPKQLSRTAPLEWTTSA